MLYTARSAEFRTEEGVLKAKETCEKYGLEGLVVIGGDGSFRGTEIILAGLPFFSARVRRFFRSAPGNKP